MPLFSSKIDYALKAVIDLAQNPTGVAVQSREIALRQDIRGPYLDQIMAVLKREGIVRSIRGAGGGYTLARPPEHITIAQIVRALVGGDLLLGGARPAQQPGAGSGFVVRRFEEEVEARLSEILISTTVADLLARQLKLDDTMSYMPAI